MLGRLLAEGVVEPLHEEPGDMQVGERRRLFGQQGQPECRVVGAEEFARMWLEGQHSERRIRPRRMGCPEHGCMAEMDPVEIAECDSRTPRVRGDRVVWADDADAHGVEMPTRPPLSSGEERRYAFG